MTLFELLNSEERLIMFSKMKLEIYSISSERYLTAIRDMLDLDRVPYYLLRKKVIKTIFCEDVIKIYVKEGR